MEKIEANAALWQAIEKVDRKYTRKIEGREFRGDTVNVIYTLKKITEHLGPAGKDWGWHVLEQGIDQFGTHEDKNFVAVHWCLVRMWLGTDPTKGIEAYGTTKLAYWTSKGKLYVDEEGRKKSISDAMSKVFVAVGGSAEVWLGEFDRSIHKYARDEEDDAPRQRQAANDEPATDEPAPKLYAIPHLVGDPSPETYQALIDGMDKLGEDAFQEVLSAVRKPECYKPMKALLPHFIKPMQVALEQRSKALAEAKRAAG